jgi:hypothetical protein
MRKIIFILLVFQFLNSCGNSPLDSYRIKSGFISEPGIYNIFKPEFKSVNIVIKEFKDNSKIFAIRDYKNKVLFQQNINESFSKYHYYCLFVDENANIWFYNSDYGSSQVIMFNENTKQYEMKDFCEEKFKLPTEFEKELNKKSTFDNCKSFNK